MTCRKSALLITLALSPLAIMRLTRLITTDKLPEMLVIGKLREKAERAEYAATHPEPPTKPYTLSGYYHGTPSYLLQDEIARRESGQRSQSTDEDMDTDEMPVSWQKRLIVGLDCPFCVGFWISLGTLTIATVCPKPLRPPLNVILGALGANYILAHISQRLDG